MGFTSFLFTVIAIVGVYITSFNDDFEKEEIQKAVSFLVIVSVLFIGITILINR